MVEVSMAEMERSGDIPWLIALQIWWAQTWRWSLITAVAVGAVWVFFTIVPLENKVSKELVQLSINLIVFVAGIWAVKRSLRARYRNFSIVIELKSSQEPEVN